MKVKLTEEQKKAFILKWVEEHPNPDASKVPVLVINYKGMVDKKEINKNYLPQFGKIFNDINGKSELTKAFIERKFGPNYKMHTVSPVKGARVYYNYFNYIPEAECIECSMVSIDKSRADLTVNNDVRRFMFDLCSKDVCYNSSSRAWVHDRIYSSKHLRNLKGTEGIVNRFYIFSDSVKVYGESGEEIWADEMGKYYNKRAMRVFTHDMGLGANYLLPIKDVVEFTEAVGKTNTCTYHPDYIMAQTYRTMQERAVSEASKKKEKNLSDIKLSDFPEELQKTWEYDTKDTSGYCSFVKFEKIDEKTTVIRYAMSKNPYMKAKYCYSGPRDMDNTIREFYRLYIVGNEVTFYKRFKLEEDLKKDKIHTINFYDSNPVVFGLKEFIDSNPTYKKIWDVTSKAKTDGVSTYSPYCNEYSRFITAICRYHRNPLSRKLIDAGFSNLFYEELVNAQGKEFMRMNAINESNQTAKLDCLKMDEKVMKLMDDFSGACKSFNRYNNYYVYTELIQYLKYVFFKGNESDILDEVKILEYTPEIQRVAESFTTLNKAIANVIASSKHPRSSYTVNDISDVTHNHNGTHYRRVNMFIDCDKSFLDDIKATVEFAHNNKDNPDIIETYVEIAMKIRKINYANYRASSWDPTFESDYLDYFQVATTPKAVMEYAAIIDKKFNSMGLKF